MLKFIPGQTYYGRAICDHESITQVTIESRTSCFVKLTTGKKFKVYLNGFNTEYIFPNGKYSMALSIYADRLASELSNTAR
jgi:hypothetical protein